MNKFTKAGLLIVTLVIPALIFTFLRFFATNHYNIPYFHPELDQNGNVIVDTRGDTIFYKVSGLKANDLKGTPLSEEIFKGKWTVANYVPALCGDTCGIVLNQLERIHNLGADIQSLTLLTLLDSNQGNKAGTQWYSSKDRWIIANVTEAERSTLLDGVLRLNTNIPKAKTNSVETKLVLVDKQGYIRGYYDGADPEDINRLMAEIKILDFEEKGEQSPK
jgi:protein SCO1/2